MLAAINFDFSNIFNGLTFEQMIMAIVAAVVAVAFGVMAGACIFYPIGYNQYGKDRAKKKTAQQQEEFYTAEQQQMDEWQDNTPVAAVADTFDQSLDNADDDLFDIVDDEEPSELQAQAAAAVAVEETTAEGLDAMPDTGANDMPSAVRAATLEDADFARLVATNRSQKPIVNRQLVLQYCAHKLVPIAPSLPVQIIRREPTHYYDRLQVAGYTFGLVFGRRKVLKLYLRLRDNTYAALSAKAAGYVEPAPEYGTDWYSWIVTDIDHCEQVLAKVLDVSYKYTAHAEFARNSAGELCPKNDSYEDKICAQADSYDRERDMALVGISDSLNERYKLEYFSKSDACQYIATLRTQGDMPPTATDYYGSHPAILKAGDRIFGIVFENTSVVKVIFRADQEMVDQLSAKHPYVGLSNYPQSRDWQWYYTILDDSYTVTDCRALLSAAYDHVVKYHQDNRRRINNKRVNTED